MPFGTPFAEEHIQAEKDLMRVSRGEGQSLEPVISTIPHTVILQVARILQRQTHGW